MPLLVAFPWYWMRCMHKIGETFTEVQVLICQAPSTRSINNNSNSKECNIVNKVKGNRIQQLDVVTHKATKLQNVEKMGQPCGIISYLHSSVFRRPKLFSSVPGAVTPHHNLLYLSPKCTFMTVRCIDRLPFVIASHQLFLYYTKLYYI